MKTVSGIILGGASCTGKSYILAEAKEFGLKVNTVEIERLHYRLPQVVEARLPDDLDWLNSTISAAEIRAEVEAVAPWSQVCRIGFLKLVTDGEPFISTCGHLPGPGDPFYELLKRDLKVRIFHVLVDPPILTHVCRIQKRRRTFRTWEFLHKQQENSRLKWDASITTADELRVRVEEWLVPRLG